MTASEPDLLPLLAALLLPAPEAQRLLARAPPLDGESVAARSAALRAEGREALLGGLGRATRPAWQTLRRGAAGAARGERARLAGLLHQLAQGAELPPGVAPLVARLLRERLGAG